MKVYELQIGESRVSIKMVGEVRNYADVSGSGIKMSFTTSLGEISIVLYPSNENSNEIKAEIDEKSKTALERLKTTNEFEKNCRLGGKTVLKAIEDGSLKIW